MAALDERLAIAAMWLGVNFNIDRISKYDAEQESDMPLAQRESLSVWNGRLWASSADDMASQFAAVILTYAKAGFQALPMMTNQFVLALRECAKVVRKAESNTESLYGSRVRAKQPSDTLSR